MPLPSHDFVFKPPFVVYAPSPGKTPAGKQKRPRAPMPGYCTNMPRPVTALATNTRYSDGDFTRSIVDPDKDAVYSAAIGPLRTFTQDVSRTAPRYTASKGVTTGSGHCAISCLAEWAKGDALLDVLTQTPQF